VIASRSLIIPDPKGKLITEQGTHPLGLPRIMPLDIFRFKEQTCGVSRSPLLAESANLRNGRDHFAIGREAMYSSRPAPRRLLSNLVRTRRRSAISDTIFAVATRRRLTEWSAFWSSNIPPVA
jgi:hypothetical protein